MSAEDANLPITNTLFPPPPAYFKAYTDMKLARFRDLSGEGEAGPSRPRVQAAPNNADVDPEGRTLTEEEEAELAGLRGQLEKPRADWVKEEGRWMCFGQMYTSEPSIPTAESIGLPPFVEPAEPPQTSLPPLLHSFLHTLLLLVDTLTTTARNPGELAVQGWAHEGDQYIQHMTNLAATMMVSVNQLRGVQAESTLVLLMEKQLAVRREQTQALRSKCQSIAATLKSLKASSAAVSGMQQDAVLQTVEDGS